MDKQTEMLFSIGFTMISSKMQISNLHAISVNFHISVGWLFALCIGKEAHDVDLTLIKFNQLENDATGCQTKFFIK